MRGGSGQGTATEPLLIPEKPPSASLGWRKACQSLTPVSIRLGGLPPNIHLCGSSHFHSSDGGLSEARREGSQVLGARPVLCAGGRRGRSRPGVRKHPQIMAEPDKFRDSRPLKGEVQPSK